MTEQPDKQMGKYLYCIIRASEPPQFQTRGIGELGCAVNTVSYMRLAAVISDSPVVVYDNSRRNMMAHTLVLEEVMRGFNFTILPVRFGTMAPNAEVIQEQLLKRRYDELNQLLGEIEGRVELGLKTFWYEGAIFEEIVAESPAVRRLRDSLKDRTPEASYYDRIRLGELVEAAMERKRNVDSEKVLARLRPLVYKTRTNKLITDRMVLNAAFLVDRENEAAFDQAVQALDADMGKRMMFKYVGPIAPYNFVNIVVRWDEDK